MASPICNSYFYASVRLSQLMMQTQIDFGSKKYAFVM